MKEGIEKTIIKGESIYLKKSFDGWRIIHPWKNEDDTLNWKNILVGGSGWNFVKVFIIVFLILFSVWAYQRDVRECSRIANYVATHPCEWCSAITSGDPGKYLPSDINFSEFLIEEKGVIRNEG